METAAEEGARPETRAEPSGADWRLAGGAEIPFRAAGSLAFLPGDFCPSRDPVGRPWRRGWGRARGCGAGAAAVMDAWVRFSAQSQARERLCRCGSSTSGGRAGTVVGRPGDCTLRGQLVLRGPGRTLRAGLVRTRGRR